MNFLQRCVYWIDLHTPLFEKLETTRAHWFVSTFPVLEWIKGHHKLLDIGSGVGDITSEMQRVLAETHGQVVGLDAEDFRRVGIRRSDPFKFVLGRAENLPFEAGSFDCVTLLWTLHHLNDPEKALEEAMRVLQIDGTIIIIEDVIQEATSFRGRLTRWYDRLINLEFSRHPHSNRSLEEWGEMIHKSFSVKYLEAYSIPWFTPLKLLTFGVLRFQRTS